MRRRDRKLGVRGTSRTRVSLCITVAVTLAGAAIGVASASHAGANPPPFTAVASPITDTAHPNSLDALASISATDLWAVGFDNDGSVDRTVAAHYDGSRWSVVTTPNTGPSDDDRLHAVAALASNDVWAVGDAKNSGIDHSLVEHWDGNAWSIVPDAGGTTALSGVAAITTTDVWAVGTATMTTGPMPVIEHWDGTSWTAFSAPPGSDGVTLEGLAVAGTTDVWALGTNGSNSVAWEFNGVGWVDRSPSVAGTLTAGDGVAPNDMWVVGSDGPHALAVHWDGTAWTVTPTPGPGATGNAFTAISSTAPNDAWAVGSQTSAGVTTPLLAHYDGSTWSEVSDAGSTDGELAAVAAISPTDVWVAGASNLSTIEQSLLETTPRASTTQVVSSANPSVSGQGVTYTATVTGPDVAPSGMVTFAAGGTTLCNGVTLVTGTATCATTFSAPGTATITASYAGDDNYVPSSASVDQTTNAAATTTALTASDNPAGLGGTVTLTASVAVVAPGAGSPSGTVTFTDGATPLCSDVAVVAGAATCATSFASAGDHQLAATYSGDASYVTSTSAALDETVAAGASATVLTSDSTTPVVGQSINFTATVSPVAPATGTPSGTVTVRDGSTVLCTVTLSGGAATCAASLAHVGLHSIVADYDGDTNFTTSTSSALSLDTSAAATTVSVSPSVSSVVTGETVTYTAVVTPVAPGGGTASGSVSFDDAGVPIPGCTAVNLVAGSANCAQTYNATGSHSISASFAGNDDYTASASSSANETVAAAPTAVALAADADPAVVGQNISFTATVSAIPPGGGTPTGTMTFLDGTAAIASCTSVAVVNGQATCSTTYDAPGTHEISASYGGDGNYLASVSPQMAETLGAGVTATALTSSANPSSAGTQVVYTAVVTVPAPAHATPYGTVSFLDAGTAIANCTGVALAGPVATCAVTYMGVGTHAITAEYSGDGTTQPSTSAALSQSVIAGTLSLSDSATAPNVDNVHVGFSPVVLNGNVQAATGTLNTTRVIDNRGTLGGWTVSGSLESPFTDGSGSVALNHVVPGENLSWLPSVKPAVPGVPNVSAGVPGHLSTSSQSILCSAPTGTGGASYDCNAALSLLVPASAAAGRYAATLDLILY
jgi:hypothetical protein